MSAFHFISAPGGAINFRGLKAHILAMSQTSGTAIDVELDYSSTLEGNRLLVQCPGGDIGDVPVTRSAYNQAQFFITPAFRGGAWTISDKGVFNEKGKLVKAGAKPDSTDIGFELRVQAQDLGDPVWIGWLALNVGKHTLELFSDGKKFNSEVIDVKPRTQASIEVDRVAGTISVSSHRLGAAKSVLVGDLVVQSIALKQIEAIKKLELKVK